MTMRWDERLGMLVMDPKGTDRRTICAECRNPILPGRKVDHGYRTDGLEVERWVCPDCDEAIQDEAMGMLP